MTDNKKGNTNSDEISLRKLFLRIRKVIQYILSQSVIILIAAIIGAVLGLTYAFIKKPIYKAELNFVLQDEKPAGGGLSSALGIASQFGIDLGGGGVGGEFTGDNLLELMRSRHMVEKTLLTAVNVNGKNETLAELYISFNNLHEKWMGKQGLQTLHFLPNTDRSKFTLKQDSVLRIFHKDLVKNNLLVDKLDKKVSIISLTVSSTNELFSKYFAEVLAKVVSDFYVQTKTEKSSRNVAILQRQTDSVRRELNAAISGVASSIDAAPNANPFLQTLRVPSQKREVDLVANRAILNELVKNLEISKMSLLQETPLIQIIDKPILPLEKQSVSKILSMITGAFLSVILLMVILLMKKSYNYILSNGE